MRLSRCCFNRAARMLLENALPFPCSSHVTWNWGITSPSLSFQFHQEVIDIHFFHCPNAFFYSALVPTMLLPFLSRIILIFHFLLKSLLSAWIKLSVVVRRHCTMSHVYFGTVINRRGPKHIDTKIVKEWFLYNPLFWSFKCYLIWWRIT